jgi:hypothetical protein
MIGKAIYARLGSYAGTSALIGGGSNARVYPQIGPQGAAYPFVAYEVFDGERYPCMGSDGDIVRPRVRLHLWDDDNAGAHSLDAQVRAALQRFSGSAGGVVIDDIFIIPGGQDIWDEEARAWHLVRDFDVICRE